LNIPKTKSRERWALSAVTYFFLDLFENTLFYYHIVVLRYTVTFTKVLTIYHGWIHPLHQSNILRYFTMKFLTNPYSVHIF
jgi:hypothetical protein